MTNECIGMNKSILISNKQIKKKKKRKLFIKELEENQSIKQTNKKKHLQKYKQKPQFIIKMNQMTKIIINVLSQYKKIEIK